jgi:hypothetical protein
MSDPYSRGESPLLAPAPASQYRDLPPWPGWRPVAVVTVRDLVVAGIVLAGVAVLGAPVGVLWSLISPRLQVTATPDGVFPVDSQPEALVADDGMFVLLTAIAGALVALAVWIAKLSRGPVTLAALAVGSVLGAVVAWQVGRHIGLAAFTEAVGRADPDKVIDQPVDLRANGALVVQAMTAVIVYVVAAGWSRMPDLGVRRKEKTDQTPSSG